MSDKATCYPSPSSRGRTPDLDSETRTTMRRVDFLSTAYCSRVNQRHFRGKTWKPSSLYYGFYRECRSGGNKLSNVTSCIILLTGEDLTSFSINNCTNFFGEKTLNEAFGRRFFWEHTQKKSLVLFFVLKVLTDLPTPKPCKSEVFGKKSPKTWRVGPQTWRFPKYVSNKTKKAGYFCDGVLYAISGLCCTVLLLFGSNKKNSVLLTTSIGQRVAKWVCYKGFPTGLSESMFYENEVGIGLRFPPMIRLIQ